MRNITGVKRGKARRAAWLGAALVVAITGVQALRAGAQSAAIEVDATRREGAVKPLIFGQNIEAGDGYQIYFDHHDYTAARTGNGLWNPETRTPVPRVEAALREIRPRVLRFPGGCLVHNYDWKKTIGPPETRPNFLFGIDEYLRYCARIGAVPMMQISDYTGTAQDAADLVAYCNLPVSSGNAWAKQRAENGHVAPYNVRYFEIGNESDDGNHNMQPPRRFTAPEYAAWVNEYSAKMKAVDAKAKIGALTRTGAPADDPWNDVVLSTCKNAIDFVVVHRYAVSYFNQNSNVAPEKVDVLMRAAMASGEQWDAGLKGFRTRIRELTGKALPMALTEYNALYVQAANDPIALRYSLGAALFSADYLRILLRPDSGVESAQYWQTMNGYFGMLHSYGENPMARQSAFYFFRLWGQHFGNTLLSTQVQTPRVEFEGYPPQLKAARGDRYQPQESGTASILPPLSAPQGSGFSTQVIGADSLKVAFDNFRGDSYPTLATINTPGQAYRLSFDARFTKTGGDLGTARLGLGMGDLRGWDATKSAIGVEGIEQAQSGDWKHFDGKFATLHDNPGASVVLRLISPSNTFSGTMEVKNLKVVRWRDEVFPAYAAITSLSSLSADGKTLYVMVFNKHHRDDIPTTIKLNAFAARTAKRWTVTGPALASANFGGPEIVRETESGVDVPLQGSSVAYRAPAHSMAAWEFRR